MIKKLPKIYTLDIIPVAGYIERRVPSKLNCIECGSMIAPYYLECDFVFETLLDCDLVASSDSDVHLVSKQLLGELNAIGAKGYKYREIRTRASKELVTNEGYKTTISNYYYLIITGRCDGPWIHNIKGKPCPECGQITAESKDYKLWLSETFGDIPMQLKLVDPETWHGEDFFLLSEPGPIVITERIASVLDRTGDLRREKVADRDMVRKLMPIYAEKLEKQDWYTEVCSKLGPADWIRSR